MTELSRTSLGNDPEPPQTTNSDNAPSAPIQGASGGEPLAIRVRFPAEPLTPASEADPDSNDEKYWAQSDAYRILRQQIQRYARGEISGQSILLAGHRGSGKTTIMHLAIQQVRWLAEGRLKEPGDSAQSYVAIPLFVPIHGPDLLTNEKKDDGQALAEHAMSQIRRALHRALAEELGARYVAIVEKDPAQPPQNREAAYQLRVELDKTTSHLALLRNYWSRAGLESTGLLSKFKSDASSERKSQAFKEIVALDTATRALAAERIREQDKPEEIPQLTPQGKESFEEGLRNMRPQRLRESIAIATPILSIVAGAWAAHSVVESTGPILAAAAGLIAAGITYSFLSRSIAFEPKADIASDASAAAQDIFLPILVRRTVDAGFAPVFVVDELDKVEGDLSELLGTLMRRIKYVVTDRAFFCFLADRAYYEQFRSRIGKASYPVEETYFADRLLIYHRHTDLSPYLEKTGFKANRDDVSADLLRYVVLCNAAGHVGGLMRAITAHRQLDGSIDVNQKPWLVPGYRFQIVMQAAIEAVFSAPSVKSRLNLEPQFTQWLNDALYRLHTEWRAERKFRFSRGARRPEPDFDPIEKILTLVATSQKLNPASGGSDGSNHNVSLDDRELDFLYSQTERLIDYLASPRNLALELLRSQRSPCAVVAVVIQSVNLLRTELLIDDHGKELPNISNKHRPSGFLWLYDYYGEPWQRNVAPPAEAKRWRDAVINDDGQSVLAARFTMLHQLTNYLVRDLSLSGPSEILNALQALPDLRNQRGWDCLDQQGRSESDHWQSWFAEENFLSVVRSISDFNKHADLVRLLALECIFHDEWHTIFAMLVMTARKPGSRPIDFAADAAKESDDILLSAGITSGDFKHRKALTAESLIFLKELRQRPQSA